MTFRFHKARHATAKAFEREFALEILKSDRLRVTILIGVIIAALLTLLGVAALGAKQFQGSLHGNMIGFIGTLVTSFRQVM